MTQNNKNEEKGNKMGYMPMNRLLISMSLPMMISMLVQAMYNIVDSIFVSRIGGEAQTGLTAVSLAFPVQTLMIAVAGGTGVGINALLSKSLGEKKFDVANKTAMNGIFLAIMSYVVFAILGIFGSHVFFASQVNNPDIPAPVRGEIVSMGTEYLTICLVFSIGLFMQFVMERLLQSTGKTIFNMFTQGAGAIINIILDPILIFGYFGAPELGVRGAAIATVIGQCCAMVLGIIFNLKYNTEIKFKIKGFRPSGNIIKRIYAVGFPSILMQAIGSFLTFGLNKILITFSDTAVSVFGIYFKLQSFIFMPVFGLNNGMIPVVAFNYGAKKKKRILDAMKYSMIYAVTIMVLGFLCFQIFPTQLLGFFNASENMLAIGVPALRIISVSFLFAGACIIVISSMQALGNGMYSLVVSVCRQLVVLLPLAYILGKSIGLNALWWAFPLAEIASVALSIIFFRKIYKNKINVL